MWRGVVLVLAAVLILPPLASAQLPEVQPARLSVTPFLGARVPFTTDRDYRLVYGDDQAVSATREEHGGGGAVGAELEVRTVGPVSIVGAVAYSRPGEVYVTIQNGGQSGQYRAIDTPDVWFIRTGVAVRLPEPTADNRRFRSIAVLWAGPALVHERFSGDPETAAELSRPISHWAANLGAKAVAPLGASRVAFLLGLEDYITFWNTAEWERRSDKVLLEEQGIPIRSDFRYPVSNILMLRTGITVQF